MFFFVHDLCVGMLSKWKFAYPILNYIPFSPFRGILAKCYAGGNPKWVDDNDVMFAARRALEVVCGSRVDE